MRFALLHHTGWTAPGGRGPHYDLLLQAADGQDDSDAVLLAFASQAEEPPRSGQVLRRIAPHRRRYLWYEGDVSGARGRVARADGGELVWLAPPDPAAERYVFELKGTELNGRYELRAVTAQDAPGAALFTLVRSPSPA